MPAPRSTYRLQFSPDFGFDAAAALVPYLAELGVSHLYAAPSLQAAPGSTHGYDVVDPSRVNDALGGEAAHARLVEALRSAGLGMVLDIVPNHMWVGGPENRFWWDVLMSGPASRWARFFDIGWEPGDELSPQRVLLPVLGEEVADAVAAGNLRLDAFEGELVLRYWDKVFPLAPGSLYAAGLAGPGDEGPEQAAARLNGDPATVQLMLERQHYRLAHWRVASQEVNYRRFFHITQLAGLRVEDPVVFDETHAQILGWTREGVVDGLRIDHPDGLRDPTGYLDRLRAAAPSAWIVVEKILEPGEALRPRWPIEGTTGYDFAFQVGGLFVDPAGEAAFTRMWAELSGSAVDWDSLMLDTKHFVLEALLAAEVERLVELLEPIARRRGLPIPLVRLRDAVRELVASWPVYRTYLREGEAAGPEDVAIIGEAMDRARTHRRHLTEVFELMSAVLLAEAREEDETELVMRFQQLTGPAMAKGVEDTAFYRYHRLVSLNEVGGSPGVFGLPVESWHAHNAHIQEHWPSTMLATSTHDTKRSEDVRARLHLLSELPERWSIAVRRWNALAERHRQGEAPSTADVYLLWQTLVGAHPISRERADAFMQKAVREAKIQTSWFDPEPAYEKALSAFVAAAFEDQVLMAELAAFAGSLVEPGRLTALSQTLLKLTAPGVPDLYQGCELWDGSLVDPDNRRPVDFAQRRTLLARLAEVPDAEAVLAGFDEGLPKLWVVRQALALRNRRPELFGPGGGYEPLSPAGSRAGHVVAYLRGGAAAVVAPRLVMGLGGAFRSWRWGTTALDLPAGRWRNLLTGEEGEGGSRSLESLLARFPVALLERIA